MKRLLTLISCAALACTASWAGDTGQTVFIDGSAVNKFVTAITFGGDNVVLTFDDGSSQTADMSLVSIDLTYTDGDDDSTAITDVTATAGGTTRVYTLSGQYAGSSTEGLARGLYIVNGKKVIIE